MQTIAEFDVTPSRLKLELTESVLIANIDDTILEMRRLKQARLNFALDDFGSGYSSLSDPQRLPLDQLKIDRSFVRGILENAGYAMTAHRVVTLGRSLGLAIIAEGVETEEQRDFPANIGCDCYQGYLSGKPVGADALCSAAAIRGRIHI